ncbi:YigZ family protein [Streptococcus pseudoporcinus]|uniref:YigZ family protein n=1 Tax=Streptococcus pseudoporcinus LQ 940-04 TaxID=875093 RepID=G5K818_9STRE|nr:YigZ family protein [Streptococcus pseudoporcinus]EFR45241.1 YigZ family protein [Streptococcus pseudoporcinus SPIN 20026]EHI64303.1 YigZ family protein [Streptococcus pseudoporcinus LQ 940-04]VEF94277.1 YigZ family protein [Streptococcus pseudoporcinus]
MKPYKTIQTDGIFEEIIKKSRFIGQAFRISNEEEGKTILAKIKKEHYKANHSCSAMIIGENAQIKRSSDDGEPSGTAGIPILSILEKQELTNILVVVTRYFGGIKLGTGGLIRAYSSVTTATLDSLQQIMVKEQVGLRVHLSYSQYQVFAIFLENYGLVEHHTVFTDQVSTTLFCDTDFQAQLIQELTEFYQGKVSFEAVDSQIVEVPI